MTALDPLKGLTRELRDAVDDVGDVEQVPAHRDEAIARLADALATRRRAQQRRRVMRGPLLAAAAAVLFVAGGAAVRHGHRDPLAVVGAPASSHDDRDDQDLGRLDERAGAVTALRDGRTEPVASGARLAEGTELLTKDSSEASLAFASGTHVTLGGGSRVRLVEQTARKRFALESGSLFAKVAKLAPNERFVVVTPDAEIEVRGTAFRVSIGPGDPACEGGSTTRLDVTEGVVTVTHGSVQVRVGAGEHWPSCAAAPTAAASAAPAPSHAVRSPVRTSTLPVASSRLAEQNDLFDDAMRRKRAGDRDGAVSQLERLLREYPRGPLAESAAAERRRLLDGASPP